MEVLDVLSLSLIHRRSPLRRRLRAVTATKARSVSTLNQPQGDIKAKGNRGAL